ncbi:hypothetical protein Csa_010632 [Cucumis sativus]|uniref:Uncharacterized protein n=1 Tax=Cucumis sativus TaxID=3659 RepID=A0A0A0L943_CUCSA|nr:hypothetical protein Csa_010632 [Cucumis sativus]
MKVPSSSLSTWLIKGQNRWIFTDGDGGRSTTVQNFDFDLQLARGAFMCLL